MTMPAAVTTGKGSEGGWYPNWPGSGLTTEVIELPVRPVRIALTDLQAAWVEPVQRRLTHICALPAGWDGYQGKPTRFDTAYFAFELLKRICGVSTPAPSIVPLPSGGLQIEWHEEELDIELTVQAPNVVEAWINVPRKEEEGVERSLTNDFGFLSPWVEKLG